LLKSKFGDGSSFSKGYRNENYHNRYEEYLHDEKMKILFNNPKVKNYWNKIMY
jgi:hypothetical protein